MWPNGVCSMSMYTYRYIAILDVYYMYKYIYYVQTQTLMYMSNIELSYPDPNVHTGWRAVTGCLIYIGHFCKRAL